MLLAGQIVLSDTQVTDAIALGQRGEDLSVRVGTVTSRGGTCNVIVDGPLARIAAAARAAFRGYRPFTAENVTPAMRAPNYEIALRGASCSSRHIVLQPLDVGGLEGIVQPVHEVGSSALFDHLPDGEFYVVVVFPSDETPKIKVSTKDRSKIDVAAGIAPLMEPRERAAPPPPASRAPMSASAGTAAREIRLVVNGDGRHAADAIAALRTELQAAGVRVTIVPSGETYDYRVVFAEGDRDAAAALALDSRGDVVAVAVRGAFTATGAAEGAARDVAKKLAAVVR